MILPRMHAVVQAGDMQRRFAKALSVLEAAMGCELDWRRVAFWRRDDFKEAWRKAQEAGVGSQAFVKYIEMQHSSGWVPVLLCLCVAHMHMYMLAWTCMGSELAEVKVAGCLPVWRQHRTLSQPGWRQHRTLNHGRLWVLTENRLLQSWCRRVHCSWQGRRGSAATLGTLLTAN